MPTLKEMKAKLMKGKSSYKSKGLIITPLTKKEKAAMKKRSKRRQSGKVTTSEIKKTSKDMFDDLDKMFK